MTKETWTCARTNTPPWRGQMINGCDEDACKTCPDNKCTITEFTMRTRPMKFAGPDRSNFTPRCTWGDFHKAFCNWNFINNDASMPIFCSADTQATKFDRPRF